MDITEVRIKLMDGESRAGNERLRGFCSITFDNAFVVRDLKIIEGTKGAFVAMPSRRLTDRCGECGTKNHLRSRYCSNCGKHLDENRAIRDPEGRPKLHADIAHPINAGCREMIQDAVLQQFTQEIELSKQPGYVSRYDECEVTEEQTDSYASVISRLDTAKPQAANPPHKRTTQPTEEPTDNKSKPSFGAGIL